MSRVAISSWSVDGLLRSGFPLVELPEQLVQHGIRTLELCHFHLPSTDSAYLQSFREALKRADVELYSILIDTGDIAAPDQEARETDLQTIREYMAVAAELGAERVRISAGRQQPTPEVVQRSAQHLHAFAHEAEPLGLHVITENWQETSQDPAALLMILDSCQGRVGLCADTGNAEATADKYATLAQLLPRASSIHFKARYAADESIAADDVQRCVDLIQGANFDGVITLIYDRKRNEWEGIGRLRDVVQPLLS